MNCADPAKLQNQLSPKASNLVMRVEVKVRDRVLAGLIRRH